jgi:pterin-4a-carbinolamine dehydratase/uncharacterized protein (DUF2267 family)
VRYEDVIDAVRERLGGAGVEEAREAVARTAGGLVLWLPREERPALRDALPAPLRPAGVEDAGVADGNASEFVRFVAGREGREPERVRYEVQAVLSALAALEPEVTTRLRRSLPDDFAELFVAPGGGAAADSAGGAAGAGVPPAELTDDEVGALLRRLPEWSGDRRRLTREVGPPDYLADQLLDRMRGLEQATGRRAVVTHQPDGSYRIEVWTHSEDQVTDLDVPFVQAIEDLIDDVLGERQPTRTPSPEREIDPRRPPAGPVPGTSDRRFRPEDH